MDERDQVSLVAEAIAAAIARRDVATLRALMAPDFIHRSHGGAAADVEAFLQGIEQIPGQIMLVRLEQMDVDLSSRGALATGIQHAQVMIDGQLIDDRRRFVDWFVKVGTEWRIQAAVDLPGT